MCGRFTLGASKKDIYDHFGIDDEAFQAEITPRYNIAPSQDVLVVLKPHDQPRRSVNMHWGLIPHWAKDKKSGYKMINARAETLIQKPAYRQAVKKRRCLIPATGYYEWKILKDKKQPYYVHYHYNDLFGFAGLWETWGKLESADLVYSCTIIRTEAGKKIGQVHNRMPVILNPELYAQWLDPENQDTDMLQDLLITDTSDLEYYPVSTAVNKPKNNGPDLIEKLPIA